MKPLRQVFERFLARLLVLVVACSIALVPSASVAHAAGKSTAKFTYYCCSSSVIDATYHPGEVLHLPWITMAPVRSTKPTVMITLTAKISGPYQTVAALKSAFARHTPRLGRFNVQAVRIRMSDGVAARPVSLIRIPSDVTAGFYELTTSITTSSLVTSSGAVIRVS